jgi:hypothetical protein
VGKDARAAGVSPSATRKQAIEEERAVEQMQNIKSDVPSGMTLTEYRRTLRRAKRHSPIRRFVSFGILR